MHAPLIIDYYSDVLCVWAWIAQRRITELEAQWGDRVILHYHYLNLFGDTATRIGKQWEDRGGYDGFGRHVREVAEPYETAPVDESVWHAVRPTTSGNAHLVVKATELVHGEKRAAELALHLRRSFFVDLADIGKMTVVLDVAADCGIDIGRLEQAIATGAAMAHLLSDYKKAEELNVKGSPTWIMNAGRQMLYGNVGYRVLNANIEEILRKPEQEASWC